jgi:hypothetical protein
MKSIRLVIESDALELVAKHGRRAMFVIDVNEQGEPRIRREEDPVAERDDSAWCVLAARDGKHDHLTLTVEEIP